MRGRGGREEREGGMRGSKSLTFLHAHDTLMGGEGEGYGIG